MKLRRLMMQAIGPFAGREVIDFTLFDDSALFLLEGPTGAGKSTIIDAITFALYGDVARQKDASKDRLRSSYAQPNDPSVVELVFEVPKGIYRIRRTPQYRKEGRSSDVNSTIHLERVSEDAQSEDGYRTLEPLSRSIREADQEIVSLVGLNKDQFLQTVVLPQGKFARFLNASSADREEILREIFDTSLYRRVQETLARAGTDAARQVERSRLSLDSSYEALHDLLGSFAVPGVVFEASSPQDSTPDEDSLPLPVSVPTDQGDLSALIDGLSERLATAVTQAQDARAQAILRRDHAETALQAGRDLDARLREFSALSAEQHLLAEHAQEIQSLRSDYQRLDALRDVFPLIEEAERTRDAVAQAREQAQDALEDIPDSAASTYASSSAFTEDLLQQCVLFLAEDSQRENSQLRVSESWDALSTRLRGVHDALVQERSQLSALLAREDSFEQRRRDLDTRTRTHAELTETHDALRLAIDQAPERRNTLHHQLEQAQGEAAQYERDSHEANLLEQRYDAATRADLLRADLVARSEALRTARIEARLAEAAQHDVHDRWLSSTASSLAASLIDEAPCPVCGSCEHPSPAVQEDNTPLTVEDVRQVDQMRREADEHLHDAQEAHRETVHRISVLNETAQGDSASLSLQLDDVHARMSRGEHASRDVERINREIETLARDLDEWHARLAELAARLSQESTQIDALRSALTADEEAYRAAAHPFPSLTLRDADLQRQLSQEEALYEACAHYASCVNLAAQASSRVYTALPSLGYAADASGYEQVRAACDDLDQLGAIEESIRLYDQRLHAVNRALDSERMRGLDQVSPPPLERLAEEAEESTRLYEAAAQGVGKAESDRDSVEHACERLSHSLLSYEQAGAQAGPAQRLAALVQGQAPENLVNTPLGSWVLISRFRELLSAANPRMLEISEGRYELQATLKDDTSTRKNGLGLAVLDHDTDEIRTPRTLSGGETFYASLALALGLADVVMAESGGIELRTMLIDEGFGSLDAEKLDIVMNQLGALRHSGRSVAVISHVTEMARRIPDQVNVRWHPNRGSHITIRA